MRKSLAEMVDEAALAALELALDEVVPAAALACGSAVAGFSACSAFECCRIADNTDISIRLSVVEESDV